VTYWNRFGLPVLLMVAFALSRWPGVMPDNFSAVYALVFCSGVFLPRRLAWWLPLVTLLLTDVLLNLHYRRIYEANPGGYPAAMEFFNPSLLANYGSYVLMIWLGTRFKPSAHWLKLMGGGILGALLFYFISNTASWWQLADYPKTLAGWIQALTVGLPGLPPTWMFFLKTLGSGGLFTGLFAAAMKLASQDASEPAPAADTDPSEPEGVQPEESKA
jgi:hypothetical protein